MLLRLSRLSSCLATAAAGMALFGPAPQRGLFTDLALALGAAAFMAWRGALAMRRRLDRPGTAIPEALPLGTDSLIEAEERVARAVAEAPAFEAALHRVAEVLRGELGAHVARVFMVTERDGAVGVAELFPGEPAFRAPHRKLPADASALARALREQRTCMDLPSAVALPVFRNGGAVALLELNGIRMTIDERALARLLASTMQLLAGTAEPAAPAALPVAANDAGQPPGAAFSPLMPLQRGLCGC